MKIFSKSAEARNVLGLAFALICAAPADARTMQQKMEAACSADVQRLCSQAATDPDRLKVCMLDHRGEVDRACMRLIDTSE